MDRFAVSHFSDDALLHDLKTRVAQDCASLAVLLTRLAEVDDRRLFLREGYPCMRDYCLHELHFSEDAAYKRIDAARTARQYSAVLIAVADGRLHLTAVLMLAPHLTSGNADELVAAATHKTRAEIQVLLAQRFPRPALPERLQAIPAPPPSAFPTPGAPQAPGVAVPLAPERVESSVPEQPMREQVEAPGSGPVSPLAPERVDSPALRSRMIPLAPERFGLQCTLDRETHDLLQHARALMSHQNPTGEIVPVLKSALQLLVGQLEKQKFAVTTRPCASPRATSTHRHIPAAVKRAVRERDGEQCTFVSGAGKRCAARSMLEFDHIEPVARGGGATVEGIRLRCRAHNQYAAERTFGSTFMSDKRAEAQTKARARRRARAVAFTPPA